MDSASEQYLLKMWRAVPSPRTMRLFEVSDRDMVEVRARSMTLALLALSAPQKEKLLFTFLLKTALPVKAEYVYVAARCMGVISMSTSRGWRSLLTNAISTFRITFNWRRCRPELREN